MTLSIALASSLAIWCHIDIRWISVTFPASRCADPTHARLVTGALDESAPPTCALWKSELDPSDPTLTHWRVRWSDATDGLRGHELRFTARDGALDDPATLDGDDNWRCELHDA